MYKRQAHVFEVDLDWEDTDDISDEMSDTVEAYKYAAVSYTHLDVYKRQI